MADKEFSNQEGPLSKHERQELSGLWEAVFGEPPTIATDPELTARILVDCLPPVGPYRLGDEESAEPRPRGS
ncbi:MAG: hypothetical protein J7521_05805 [Caulobacter sp.]|nr:hypothetical protein [Caulobacter sp.]